MANTKQAKKRARQAVKHRAHNMAQRSALRTSIKRVRTALADGNKTDAAQAYQEAVPLIDRMARIGIIHANNAARQKSRLNHSIKALTA